MGRVRSLFSSTARRASTARRRGFVFVFVLFVLVLFVVNFVNWRMYRGMRDTLDGELGERLKAIAAAATQPIDPGYIAEIREDPEGAIGAFIVFDQFERLRNELDVANMVLLDLDGRTLVDLGRTVPPLASHPLSVLHAEAFAAAKSGIEATSDLYESLGQYYKNGYAPVRDIDGHVTGIVSVEVGAGFFDALDRVRHTVWVVNGASVVAILILGAAFYRLLRVRARLDETLRRTETLSLMGEMAASVAHEIKNPLSIIRAAAERIRKRVGTGEEIFDYIPEEVDRLNAILGTYLDFARGGATAAEGGRCDVGEVVESVLRLVRRDLVSGGIHVTESLTPPLPAALPASNLQQVLLNLVVNARRAMPDGGELVLSGRRDGKHIEVEVRDTGAGIDASDLDRVFQPFYSGEESGSGLGLAIVQRVVEDAGGRVGIESEAGRGTRVSLRLPAAGDDQSD